MAGGDGDGGGGDGMGASGTAPKKVSFESTRQLIHYQV